MFEIVVKCMSWNNKEEIETICSSSSTVQQWGQWRYTLFLHCDVGSCSHSFIPQHIERFCALVSFPLKFTLFSQIHHFMYHCSFSVQRLTCKRLTVKITVNLIFIGQCIVIYSHSPANKMHPLYQIIYSRKTLYMFRTVFSSIIRSSKLRI
jgi:hypothetical protein